jgi:hypothetical protein
VLDGPPRNGELGVLGGIATLDTIVILEQDAARLVDQDGPERFVTALMSGPGESYAAAQIIEVFVADRHTGSLRGHARQARRLGIGGRGGSPAPCRVGRRDGDRLKIMVVPAGRTNRVLDGTPDHPDKREQGLFCMAFARHRASSPQRKAALTQMCARPPVSLLRPTVALTTANGGMTR